MWRDSWGNNTGSGFITTEELGITDVEGWQTTSTTITQPAGSYDIEIWLHSGEANTRYHHEFEISEPQFQVSPNATPWVGEGWTFDPADNWGSLWTGSAIRSGNEHSYTDLTGNNYHGDMPVSFQSTLVPESSYYDFTFDGTDDKVIIDPYLTFSDEEEWTFSTWAYCTSGAADPTWEALAGSNSANGFIMFHSSNTLVFRDDDGNYRYSTSMSTTVNNRWINAVVIANGTGINFYINGSVQDGGTQSCDTWMRFNHIGSGQSNRYFQGEIGSTMIYNRALSSTEVKQNFDAHKTLYGL